MEKEKKFKRLVKETARELQELGIDPYEDEIGAQEEAQDMLTVEEVHKLFQFLQREKFDGTRLNLLRGVYPENRKITSGAARSLAGTFNYDYGKIDALCYLYPFVTDKENFIIVTSQVIEAGWGKENLIWHIKRKKSNAAIKSGLVGTIMTAWILLINVLSIGAIIFALIHMFAS